MRHLRRFAAGFASFGSIDGAVVTEFPRLLSFIPSLRVERNETARGVTPITFDQECENARDIAN